MAAAHSTASVTGGTYRKPPAGITVFSVEAGNELIARTIDPVEAERRRTIWNTITEGMLPEARIVPEVYSGSNGVTVPQFSVLGLDGVLLRSPSMAAVGAFVDGWVSAGGNRDDLTILPRWLDRQSRKAVSA